MEKEQVTVHLAEIQHKSWNSKAIKLSRQHKKKLKIIYL